LTRGASGIQNRAVPLRVLLATAALGLFLLAAPPLWYAVFPERVPELPPPGRRIEVSPGLGVNVLEAGAGAPLVLVHGHPGSAYGWEPFVREAVARGFRAIAYDRVGYGRSDARAPGHVTVETNAAELLALLAALELRDVTLLGFS
jgi:pimeloyl-ACP methyl ester carboxylesterase